MTDWFLLGGLVALDQMGQRAFWRLLLVTPVTLVAIYLMLPRRLPLHKARFLLVGLYGLFWVNFVLSHLAGTPRPITGELGSLVRGALEYVIFPLYFSKYRGWRTCFLVLTVGVISIQSESIATLLLARSDPAYSVHILVGAIFSLLLAYFVRCQRGAIWDLMEHQTKGWFKFCSIPALVLCMIYLFRSYPDPLSATVQNPVGIILVSLFHPIVYWVLFDALRTQHRQAGLEQNAAMLQMQIAMVEEQSQMMERHIQADAVARHDQRHFHQVLLAHLDAGDIGGARAAIREQLGQGEKTVARYCEDPVLNQLLAYFAQWCEKENIQFTAQVRLPGEKVSGRTELMVALCNILENAVHACIQLQDPAKRQLRVRLLSKGRQIYLESVNSYAGVLELDPATGLPRTDEPGHGYGLQSIAGLAGGQLACSAENGVFRISMLV